MAARDSQFRSGGSRSGETDQRAFGLVRDGGHSFLVALLRGQGLIFFYVAALVAATRALFGNIAKNSRTILASKQNFSERLNSLLPHGKKGKLAVFCGVEASTVSRWLNGSATPVGESCFKIAEFLGVDAKWLLEGENTQSSANLKDSDVGESACVMREESPIYAARAPQPLTLDERVEKLEKIMKGIQDALNQL
jgi:transcriptional regulator with XRE-family HTH domain